MKEFFFHVFGLCRSKTTLYISLGFYIFLFFGGVVVGWGGGGGWIVDLSA